MGGFSGAGFKGITGEAAIGGSSNVATALTVGQYYQYDKDHQVNGYTLLTTGSIGAGFGGVVKGIEERKFVIEFIKRSFK